MASYTEAFAGCPVADLVVACVAGAGTLDMRAVVEDVVSSLQPGACVHVVPDYVAAWRAVSPIADVAVIAGTGSVVCTPDDSGGWDVSGGRGWILGDHGSAARLGQALLGWYAESPSELPEWVRSELRTRYGSSDWHWLVRILHEGSAPASLLSRGAPILTALADQRHPRATEILRTEMALLAAMTSQHVTRLLGAEAPLRVGLVGGVWRAPSAVTAFAEALSSQHPTLRLADDRPRDPLDGAESLAHDLRVTS
nr:hypothetical protein [Geodermatophilus normandii]